MERAMPHETLTAVETIKAKLSAIEKIKMDLTYLMNERADLTKRIDALLRQMEKETTELRHAESAYAVTLVLAKE
jgi:predicted  nucleic acid-binding Zn-ribbon protein